MPTYAICLLTLYQALFAVGAYFRHICSIHRIKFSSSKVAVLGVNRTTTPDYGGTSPRKPKQTKGKLKHEIYIS